MHDEFKYCLKDGHLTHISEVENGVQNCVCPSCLKPFVAYKKHQTPHFKHKAHQGCKYSFETSLHYLAKEIIAEQKYLPLPDLDLLVPDNCDTFFPEEKEFRPSSLFKTVHKHIKFDKIEVEKWEGNFKPDLKCYHKGKPMLVEITVTHGIDEIKLEKVKANDIPLLEIDLSTLKYDLTKDKIINAIYKDTYSRRMKWVYNPKELDKKAELYSKIWAMKSFVEMDFKEKKLYGKNLNVYHCPFFKERNPIPQYESFEDCCNICRFRLDVIEKEVPDSKFNEKFVRCVGHRINEIDNYLDKVRSKI